MLFHDNYSFAPLYVCVCVPVRREPGQGTTEELQKQDFAKVLEEKEKNVTAKAIGGEPPV